MLRLLWADIAPARPFHAMRLAARDGFALHCHDFWEIMCWQSGHAIHRCNGVAREMALGEALLVRPDDGHALEARGACAYFNVAIRADFFEKFCALAGLGNELEAWRARPHPPRWNGAALVPALERMARAFAAPTETTPNNDDALLLAQFLAEVGLNLRAARRARELGALPDWLQRARNAMDDEANLRGGVPRLTELARVSPGHLSRAWKAAFGQHPTEWVNARRLEHAALLLLESNAPIAEIAACVGFENLAYFYRLFTARFHRAPRAYRLQSRAAIAP